MSETLSNRLTRAVGQLALALVDATLLLVVAALFLGWSLAQKVERISEVTIASATQQIAAISPVADQVAGLKEDLGLLRADVADLRLTEDGKIEQTASRIITKLDALEVELSDVNATLAPTFKAMSTDPGIVVDRAVTTSLAEVGAWITSLSSCHAPAKQP